MKNPARAILWAALLLVLAGCDTGPAPFDGGLPDAAQKDSILQGDALRDGGAGDAPGPDAGVTGDGAQPEASSYHAVYPTSRTHSPITPHVVSRLKQISAASAKQNPRVFSKIGDSITVSTHFMHCLAGAHVILQGRTHLQPTINHFKLDLGGGVTPFNRSSLCAISGWSASTALSGNPSPLQKEIAAAAPRFAVVMYGTNDIGGNNIFGYADNMLNIVDTLIQGGVIPLLSAIPPRDDSAWANTQVPRYNAVVRGIAQARQVPFMDYHRELLKLKDHGMSKDGVHPSAYYTPWGARSCDFTPAGLQYGYNVRNLISLESLHRAKAVVLDSAAAPDAPGQRRQGDGSPKSPIMIKALPFTDLRNTKGAPHKNIHTYPGCKGTQNESGPEFLYRLTLTKAVKIRAMVFDRNEVDIDVHLLDTTATGAGCIQRSHNAISAQLQPGTYHFSLDTFVNSSSKELAGEYLFVVLED